jgi:hypothetical protein
MGKRAEELGENACEKMRKMFLSGMSLQAIADDISGEFGEISRKEVQGFIKRESKSLLKIERAEKGYEEKVLDTYREAVGQFKELNNEAWKIFYDIKKEAETSQKLITCEKCHHKNYVEINNYNPLIKSCDHLLAQITLSNKILKNLGSSKPISINVVDFSRKLSVQLPALLKTMEAKNFIKILPLYKRRMKQNKNQDYSEKEDKEDDSFEKFDEMEEEIEND